MLSPTLGPLLPPTPLRVYLLRDDVWAAPGPDHRGQARRVGPTDDYFRLLRTSPAPGFSIHKALGLAGCYLERRAEARFCLTELLPALRALYPVPGQPRCESPAAGAGIDRIERAAAALLESIDVVRLADPYLARHSLPVPCAIVGVWVIPLASLPSAEESLDPCVSIGKHRYRYCLDRIASLNPLLERMRHDAWQRLARASGRDPALKRRRAALLRVMAEELRRQQPVGRDKVLLLFNQRGYRLEHEPSSAEWRLVRGPLPGSNRERPLTVSLDIRGATRQARLAVTPKVSNENPLRRRASDPDPLCMGSPAQYRPLHSPILSEAEAVLDYLDAAAAIATGRTRTHDAYRRRLGLSSKPAEWDRLTLCRGVE